MNAPAAFDTSGFPSLPQFGAHWMPIYWEPIPSSGERITLAVAARTIDGELRIHPAATVEAWECFLGSKAGNVARLIALLQRSLSAHTNAGKWLQHWKPPLSGLQAGEVRWALGRDWTDILRTGLADSAFLSSLYDALPEARDPATSGGADDQRWPSLVRNAVHDLRPDWGDRFNRAVKGRGNARESRIDYLGHRYCAGFARLMPGASMGRTLQSSKAKLLDLDLVRFRAQESDLLPGTKPEFELLTYVPSESDPSFREEAIREAHAAFAQLEEFADRHEMRVERFHSALAAAQRIIEKDAA